MLQKIAGRFGELAQMKQFVADAEEMINKYGWQDRTVMPYGFAMPIMKIVNDCKDYSRCTLDSQAILISLANGLVDIMNAWEADHNAPKVTIRQKKTGKLYTINADMVDMFQNDEFEIVS